MTVLHKSVELLQTLLSHQCFLFADSSSLYDYNYTLKRTQYQFIKHIKMFSEEGMIKLTISRFPASIKSVLNATCVINLYWVALIPALSDALMALNRDDATNGRVLVQFYAHPY